MRSGKDTCARTQLLKQSPQARGFGITWELVQSCRLRTDHLGVWLNMSSDWVGVGRALRYCTSPGDTAITAAPSTGVVLGHPVISVQFLSVFKQVLLNLENMIRYSHEVDLIILGTKNIGINEGRGLIVEGAVGGEERLRNSYSRSSSLDINIRAPVSSCQVYASLRCSLCLYCSYYLLSLLQQHSN